MRIMTKKTKIKISIIAVVLLIVFPVIIYLILTTPSPIGFINSAEVGAWMGYYAAILGGSLTLLGVYVTIKNLEETNRDEKAIQFKPILAIAADAEIPQIIGYREVGLGVPGYSSNSGEPPKYISKNENEKEKFFIVIKNRGRGETSNAKLKSLEIVDQDMDWTGKNELRSSWSESNIGEILSQEFIKIIIYLPKYLLIKKEVDLNKTLKLNTIMRILYDDMFGENSYMYTIHIRFSINLDAKDYEEVTNDLLAVRASYKLEQIMPQREKLKPLSV